MIGLCIYIAGLFTWGLLMDALLHRSREPRRLLDLLGMSLCLGSGALPALLMGLSMLGIAPKQGIVFAVCLAGFLGLIALAWRRRLPQIALPIFPRLVRSEWIFMLLAGVLIGVQVLAIGLAAFTLPAIEVDAWNIWGLKAKVLYFEPMTPRPAYFSDLSLSYSHLDYPLLVPMLWAGVYGAMGGVNDLAGKGVLAVPALGMILLLYGALRDLLHRPPAMLLTAIATGVPAMARWNAQGVADPVLATFMLGAAVCLMRWLESQRTGDLIAAGIFSSFAALTKLEGSILPFSVLLAIVLLRPRRWAFAAYGITLALLVFPWFLWSRGLPRTHEDYVSRLTASQLSLGMGRLAELAGLIATQLWNWLWVIPIGMLLLTALAGWRGFRDRRALAVWIVLLVQLSACTVAYLVTPWELPVLVPITAARLLLHVLPLIILLTALHWRAAEASR